MKRSDNEKSEKCKRIPSSFDSSAVLNAKYLVPGAGERMAMTVLPPSNETEEAVVFQRNANSELAETSAKKQTASGAPLAKQSNSPPTERTSPTTPTTTATTDDKDRTEEVTEETEESEKKKREKAAKRKAKKAAKRAKKAATREGKHRQRKTTAKQEKVSPFTLSPTTTATNTTRTTKATQSNKALSKLFHVQSEAVGDQPNPSSAVLLPSAVAGAEESSHSQKKDKSPATTEATSVMFANPKAKKAGKSKRRLNQQQQQQKEDNEGEGASNKQEAEVSKKRGQVPMRQREQKALSPLPAGELDYQPRGVTQDKTRKKLTPRTPAGEGSNSCKGGVTDNDEPSEGMYNRARNRGQGTRPTSADQACCCGCCCC